MGKLATSGDTLTKTIKGIVFRSEGIERLLYLLQ
jgi:hypothetical protein